MAGLEIGAAVIGLIAGTGQTISWICTTLETISDVPSSVKAVQTSLEEMHIILEGLQQFLEIHSASTELQRSPVPIPRIADTMTGVVMTVSELQRQIGFAQNLTGKIKVFDRGKWWYREKQIEDARKRLESHKSSLSAMLGILQCHLMQETKQAFSQRLDRVTTADPNTHARMQFWKQNPSTYPSKAPSEIDNGSLYDNEGGYEALSAASLSIFESPYRHEFEQILEASGPYAKIDFAASYPTFTSRIGSERGVTASIFSRLTVDTISNIAVYNLPIQPTDIYNADWYEFEGRGKAPTVSFVPDIPDRQYETSVINTQNSDRGNTGSSDYVGPSGQLHTGDQSNILPKATFSENSVDSVFYWYPKSLNRHGSSVMKNPKFVERDDIMTEMQTIVNKRSRRIPVIILWGSPGCGKTEIAIEFASNCRNTGCKIQIWIHATDRENVINGFSNIAGELGVCPSLTRLYSMSEKLRRARALQQWLGSTDIPWLLVFDDLPTHTALFEFALPNSPHGIVVGTTRARIIFPSRSDPPKWTAVEVGSFNKVQTLSMMNQYEVESGLQSAPELTLEFANVAGYNPLIVRAFLEYSKERGATPLPAHPLSITSILENFTMKHGYRTSTHNLEDNAPLYQAWAYELRKLGAYGGELRDQIKLLRVISFLDTNIFTINLLESIRRHLNPNEERALPAGTTSLVDLVPPSFLSEKFEVTSQIQRLSRFSFIMEMQPSERIDVFRAACSWLVSTLGVIPQDLATTAPPSGFHLEFLDYTCHLSSIITNFDKFLQEKFSEYFYLSSFFEFLSVLRVALAYPISAELSKETVDILKRCREIYNQITDKFKDEIQTADLEMEQWLPRYTFSSHHELAESMYFRASEYLKLGNCLAAISFYNIASFAVSELSGHVAFASKTRPPKSLYQPVIQTLVDQKIFYGMKIAMFFMVRTGSKKLYRPAKFLNEYLIYRDIDSPSGDRRCIHGQSMFLRANILVKKEKLKDTLKKYDMALNDLEKCYGMVHPWIGSILAQIGHVKILMKKWTPAIVYLNLALEIYSTGDNVEDPWFIRNRARITYKLFHAYNSKATRENDSESAELAADLKEKLDEQALRPGPLDDSWTYYDELVQRWECNPNDCHHIRTLESYKVRNTQFFD